MENCHRAILHNFFSLFEPKRGARPSNPCDRSEERREANGRIDTAGAIGETVLACCEKLDTLREPKYFRTWLTRILINKCQDLLRQQGRCVPLETAAELAYHEPGQTRAEFLALLDSLDEKYRTVLLLYYGEGFRVAEIAQMLDLKEETVKTRLKRARAGFKQVYEAE